MANINVLIQKKLSSGIINLNILFDKLDRNPKSASIFVSVILHLIIIVLSHFFYKKYLESKKNEIEKQQTTEITIIIPDLIAEEKKVEKKKQEIKKIKVIDVGDGKKESIEEPKDYDFISHTNTNASSLKASLEQNPDELKIATQDGLEKKSISILSSEYVRQENTKRLKNLNEKEDTKLLLKTDENNNKVNNILDKSLSKIKLENDIKKNQDKEQIIETSNEEFIKQIDIKENVDMEQILPPIDKDVKKDFVELMNRKNPKNLSDEKLTSNQFKARQRKTKEKGNIYKIGLESSVNAKKTHTGKYIKKIKDRIAKMWYFKHEKYSGLVNMGSLIVQFSIKADGSVDNVKVVLDDAGGLMKSYSLEAIYETKLPPMPKEMIDEIGDNELTLTYDFMVY